MKYYENSRRSFFDRMLLRFSAAGKMSRVSLFLLPVVCLLLFAGAGCSKSSHHSAPESEISGVVFDDPLANAILTFYYINDSGEAVEFAVTETDENGQFSVTVAENIPAPVYILSEGGEDRGEPAPPLSAILNVDIPASGEIRNVNINPLTSAVAEIFITEEGALMLPEDLNEIDDLYEELLVKLGLEGLDPLLLTASPDEGSGQAYLVHRIIQEMNAIGRHITESDDLAFTMTAAIRAFSRDLDDGELDGSPADAVPDGATPWADLLGGLQEEAQRPVVLMSMSEERCVGTEVVISAGNSWDPSGQPLAFMWEQTQGETIETFELSPNGDTLTFSMPEGMPDTTYAWRCTAENGDGLTDMETVSFNVPLSLSVDFEELGQAVWDEDRRAYKVTFKFEVTDCAMGLLDGHFLFGGDFTEDPEPPAVISEGHLDLLKSEGAVREYQLTDESLVVEGWVWMDRKAPVNLSVMNRFGHDISAEIDPEIPDPQISISATQAGPGMWEDEFFVVPFCIEITDGREALLDGTLEESGPDAGQSYTIEENLCGEISHVESCNIGDGSVEICGYYHFHKDLNVREVSFAVENRFEHGASTTFMVPENEINIDVQMGNVMVEGPDEFSTIFSISITDQNNALLGGRLRIEGPVDEDEFSLDAEFCNVYPGEDCDLTAGALTATGLYSVHGDEDEWEVEFTVMNALGHVASTHRVIHRPDSCADISGKWDVVVTSIETDCGSPGDTEDVVFTITQVGSCEYTLLIPNDGEFPLTVTGREAHMSGSFVDDGCDMDLEVMFTFAEDFDSFAGTFTLAETCDDGSCGESGEFSGVRQPPACADISGKWDVVVTSIETDCGSPGDTEDVVFTITQVGSCEYTLLIPNDGEFPLTVTGREAHMSGSFVDDGCDMDLEVMFTFAEDFDSFAGTFTLAETCDDGSCGESGEFSGVRQLPPACADVAGEWDVVVTAIETDCGSPGDQEEIVLTITQVGSCEYTLLIPNDGEFPLTVTGREARMTGSYFEEDGMCDVTLDVNFTFTEDFSSFEGTALVGEACDDGSCSETVSLMGTRP